MFKTLVVFSLFSTFGLGEGLSERAIGPDEWNRRTEKQNQQAATGKIRQPIRSVLSKSNILQLQFDKEVRACMKTKARAALQGSLGKILLDLFSRRDKIGKPSIRNKTSAAKMPEVNSSVLRNGFFRKICAMEIAQSMSC